MEMPECNTGVDCSECIGGCNTNLVMGFEDMTAWEKEHPGTNEYTCEFCGIYLASIPHCNKCEKE